MDVLVAPDVTRSSRPLWFKVRVVVRRARWLMGVTLLALVAALAGCKSMSRGPDDHSGPFGKGSNAALPNGAMLDHDFKSWPGGTAVPPAGLGIDTVRTPGTSAQ